MRRLLATPLLAAALLVGGATAASADAIPGDDACKPWEHWEGAHEGGCEFGCSVTAPTSAAQDAAGWIAGATLAGIALIFLRRR